MNQILPFLVKSQVYKNQVKNLLSSAKNWPPGRYLHIESKNGGEEFFSKKEVVFLLKKRGSIFIVEKLTYSEVINKRTPVPSLPWKIDTPLFIKTPAHPI